MRNIRESAPIGAKKPTLAGSEAVGTVAAEASFNEVAAVVVVLGLEYPGGASEFSLGAAVGHSFLRANLDLIDWEVIVLALFPVAFAPFIVVFETGESGDGVLAEAAVVFDEHLVGERVARLRGVVEKRLVGIGALS